MGTIVEEYGMFSISLIVFMGVVLFMHVFQTQFKDASKEFVGRITGVSNTEYK